MIETWEQFKGILKLYGNAISLLNPPCSVKQIHELESKFDFELPSSLKTLLVLNNGQRFNDEASKIGVFKSISGWDVYRRPIFLGIEAIEIAYKTFIDDTVLLAAFGKSEIPFAVVGSPTQYEEAFCINYSTGAVSLIWTRYIDPFNSPECLVHKFILAESLMKFIEKQIEFYR